MYWWGRFFENYLVFFNKFYAPKIVNVIYWVSVVLYILAGLFLVIEGYGAEERIKGLFLFIFGPVIARILAELTVIPFKIYAKVSKIADTMLTDEEKDSSENNMQAVVKETE